jgi:HEAT repeat protein
MTRLLFAAVVCASLVSLHAASGQDAKKPQEKPKEKEFLGKTIGEWIKILREDQDAKRRWAAVKVLDISEAASTTAFPAILNAIEKDKDASVRIEGINVIGRFDPKKRPAAIKAIVAAMQNDKDGAVREAAATTLGSIKLIESKAVDEFVNELTAALKDPHVGTRAAVAITLRNLGEGAKPAVSALLDAANDPKEAVSIRITAVHVVSRYGKDNSRTLPLLIRLAKEHENPVGLREIALDGLGRSGSDANEVNSVLTGNLREKNIELRKAASVSLGMLGTKAKAAWPAVKENLAYQEEAKGGRLVPVQPDSSVRNHLIRLAGVLGKSSPEAVLVLLTVAKIDDSTENRIAAIQELGELGSLAKSALDQLNVIAQQDGRAAVRDAASKAVKNISAP